LKMAGTVFF